MVLTKERKKTVKAVPGPGTMTKEDMEVAAYFHWLGRGCPPDDALTDWIEVENKWRDKIVPFRND